MNPPKILYATDEDIAVRAPSDFTLLCPREQVLAVGRDGAFGASDPWLLQSAEVSFSALGLAPGHVVQLTAPASSLQQTADLLAVDEVLSEGLRLRRKGQPVGVGMPPGLVLGLTGIAFLVATFAPQIEAATGELNRRCGIGPPPGGQLSIDPSDLRELREATVLTILHDRYLDLSQDVEGVLAFKARVLKVQRDGLLAAFTPRGLNAGADNDRVPPAFGTRISR